MVKDECDIIEHFVRWNLKVVDHIFIVDHNSHDGTPEILKRLQEEGLPLTVWKEERIDHKQAAILTEKIEEIAETKDFDFITPIDADEFIYCSNGQFGSVLENDIAPGHCGIIPWITYVPTSEDCLSTAPPKLHEAFLMQELTENPISKVIIPNDTALSTTLAEGNHYALFNGTPVASCSVSAALLHVPIRSAPQLIKKALNGTHKLSIKESRFQNEGEHWDAITKYIRRRNYQLTLDDLTWLAKNYAKTDLENRELICPPLTNDGPKVGVPYGELKYTELANSSPIRTLDSLALELCNEIRSLRTTLSHERATRAKNQNSKSLLKSLFKSITKN